MLRHAISLKRHPKVPATSTMEDTPPSVSNPGPRLTKPASVTGLAASALHKVSNSPTSLTRKLAWSRSNSPSQVTVNNNLHRILASINRPFTDLPSGMLLSDAETRIEVQRTKRMTNINLTERGETTITSRIDKSMKGLKTNLETYFNKVKALKEENEQMKKFVQMVVRDSSSSIKQS